MAGREWWRGCFAPFRVAAFGVRGCEGEWVTVTLPAGIPYGTGYATTKDRSGNESCGSRTFAVGK